MKPIFGLTKSNKTSPFKSGILPVNSHSYATAASTTGTVLEPKDLVNPFTLTVTSWVDIITELRPTTGESAWLSMSSRDVVAAPPNSIADALGWIITKDKIHFDYKQNLIFNIE